MAEQRINVLRDASELAEEAARLLAEQADEAIQTRGEFSLVLAGGSTPAALYRRLAAEPYRSGIDWSRVKVFFGDERCVPPDNEQSNYRMANQALLSVAPIPQQNIHRMRGEIDPQAAAIEYGQMLKEHFGAGGADLVLLGMGDDGHTASLFPHTEALHEAKHRCVANYVEKLGAWRLTMTVPFINRAERAMVLVSGSSKVKALQDVLEGPSDPLRLPIQLISPQRELIWLIDAAAAGMA